MRKSITLHFNEKDKPLLKAIKESAQSEGHGLAELCFYCKLLIKRQLKKQTTKKPASFAQ